MQVLERLIAMDLDGAANTLIFLGELPADRTTNDPGFQGVDFPGDLFGHIPPNGRQLIHLGCSVIPFMLV